MQPRNPYLCLTIVIMLGSAMLIGLLGIILLAVNGRETPSALVAIASGAIGSLSSFLVNVPRGSVGGDDPATPPRPAPTGRLP